MKKDGTAAYGTVFQVIFVITDDINLNVNLLSTIRTTNLHLINVAHYKLQIRYSKHIFEQFLDRQRLSRLGAASHQKEDKEYRNRNTHKPQQNPSDLAFLTLDIRNFHRLLSPSKIKLSLLVCCR
jgi:hypothetical protein